MKTYFDTRLPSSPPCTLSLYATLLSQPSPGSTAQLAQSGQDAGESADTSSRRGSSRRGSDADRSRRRLAADDNQQTPAEVPGGATPDTFPQLAGLRFSLKRGELLGICGEVGVRHTPALMLHSASRMLGLAHDFGCNADGRASSNPANKLSVPVCLWKHTRR